LIDALYCGVMISEIETCGPLNKFGVVTGFIFVKINPLFAQILSNQCLVLCAVAKMRL
jgi:hypothetical protein